MRGWHVPELPLIERGYPLPALPPAHDFSNSSARVIPDSTTIDRVRVPPTSSIGKARMTPASFTAIDYEEWLLVRVLRGQSTRGLFSNAKRWRGDIGSRSILKRRSYIKRKLYIKCRSEGGGVFGVSWNHPSWNCSDEVVCRVRWPGHVTRSLH